MRRVLIGFATALAAFLSDVDVKAQVQSSVVVGDEFTDRIKPIFDSRCIACHSCYNAPCQLNLQSYSGATRGATTHNVYEASRLHSVAPTRLDIDATSPTAWRDKGFHDVLGAGSGDAKRSLLLSLVRLRHQHGSLQPTRPATELQVCPVGANDPRIVKNEAVVGMPYGLPPLSSAQIDTLAAWLQRGAPGPNSASKPQRDTIAEALRSEVHAWEHFLNDPDPRQKLVSHYVYEHLFLAHLHFAGHVDARSSPTPVGAARSNPPPFFRLVRSRSPCDQGIEEIATRRPTDTPGTSRIYYCLRPVTGTIVEKTHIPYELSPQKLERIRSIFLGGDWSVTRAPTYGDDQANNPFVKFRDIPVKARYQFLLDDAHFYVANFIKGPVCNGASAVDSIQEQFFVFFLTPEADNMVKSARFAAAAQDLLILPGAWGSDITVQEDLPFLTRLMEHREKYRELRAEGVRKLRPNGYSLDDLWDGDGTNPNALLTVFRHNDNAAVRKGAIGDLPKTGFVLDYPLFERLVYNLVVNFDVFGNVGHQVLTRVYMDLIRMEAEELFLSFLSPSERQPLRHEWYKGGLLTDIKLNIVYPLKGESQPTAVKFRNTSAHKLELVQRALFERLPAPVRGRIDAINWRMIKVPANAGHALPLSSPEQGLRRLASIRASDATPFARYFPDLAMLLLHRKDGGQSIYSIVHNREHANVSWIMGDRLRRAPSQDTLTIVEGVLGAYPNMFFELDEEKVDAFSAAATGITSPGGYARLVDRFGIRRTSERFWRVYDEINAIAQQMQPIERGTLDLTRYALEGR